MRYLPVEHSSNRSWSEEEVAKLALEYEVILRAKWTNRAGKEARITENDLLVVTPYNAQAARLAAALPPGSRIGTVDRFQGQEACVVFFAMATSAAE